MVPIHNAISTSTHGMLTPRIVPKSIRKVNAASTPGAGGLAGSSTATSIPPSDPAADFKSLFGHATVGTTTAALPTAPKPVTPTLQSVFGTNPYVSQPGGVAPNGVSYSYNPTYFATRATADKLAQMYGGKVVEMNAITPFGPFQQNQRNEMIQFPNGNVVNAGILASYFDHGWSQEQINTAIAGEINQIPG